MLIDDEITTRTTRRWHHICQWNRLDEYCYKCSHSLQTYTIDTIHYIQTWIIDCCADEIRNSFEPLVQLCSLSVTQWVSHSIIHSVGSLVSPSVSQSVDQACLHSLSRRGCLLCVGLSFVLSATSFPVFLVCSNDAPWNAMMDTLQWGFSIHWVTVELKPSNMSLSTFLG